MEYYYKLGVLIIDGCPRPLRELFLQEAKADTRHAYTDLPNFLSNHQSLILQKVRFKSQRDLLYPPTGTSVDPDKWDVTLLCSLVQTLFPSLPWTVLYGIDKVKNVRNTFQHMSATDSITSAEFKTMWTDLDSGIMAITDHLVDTSYKKTMTDFIQDLKDGPLPLTGSKLDDMKARLEEMKSLWSDVHSIAAESNKILKRAASKTVKRTGKVAKRISVEDSRLKHLKGQMISTMKNSLPDNFIPPQEASEIEAKLKEDHRVVICGQDSKLSLQTALFIIKKMNYNLDRSVIMKRPTDWFLVCHEDVDLTLYLDPFGGPSGFRKNLAEKSVDVFTQMVDAAMEEDEDVRIDTIIVTDARLLRTFRQNTTHDMTADTAVCTVGTVLEPEEEQSGNTTNFAYHLDKEHKEASSGSKVDVPSASSKQMTLDAFRPQPKPVLTTGQQAEVNDALCKLLVGKVLPLSLVDNEHFKNFVSILNPRYTIPCRRTVGGMLAEKKKKMEEKVRQDIKECEDVAITHDGWTSINTESFGTVTAHFISKEWQLRSVVLETHRVEGSHTADNLQKHLLAAQTKWKLPAKPTAVTDNAANEKKAIELLEWTRFGCYGHRLNLIVKKALAIPELQKIVSKGRKIVTYFHQSSSTNDMLLSKQKLLLPEGAVGHKLKMDCPTRWNSTYDMVRRLLEQIPAIMGVITDPSLSKSAATTLKNSIFNFDEQALMEQVVQILEPFLRATNSVCADQTPTMCKIIPIIMKLSAPLASSESDSPLISEMKSIMRVELNNRTQDRELGMMACMLNPYMKNLDFLKPEGHELLLRVAIETCHDVVVKAEPVNTMPPLPSLPEAAEPEPLPTLPEGAMEESIVIVVDESKPSLTMEPKCKKPKLADMDEWLQDIIFVGQTQLPTADIIQQEVARYLAVNPKSTGDQTALQWWKENGSSFPRMSRLARKYLSIPASSVPSERVFSLAGNLVNKKRARLSNENIDSMIFLNKNLAYW